MIAATYTQNRGYRVEDVPIPDIGNGELLLRVAATSICGTDLRIIRSGHRKLKEGQKIVLGHEFVGVVVKCGRRAGDFQPGCRVGVAPNVGCGRCDMCLRGMPNMCPDYTAFGITMDGSHAEFVRVPHAAIAQGSVAPLPDEVSAEQGSLIEPLSCVVHGNRSVRVQPGETIVIFGAGPIGLMHVMLARLCGVAQLLVVDVRADRLEQARELGATAVIDASRQDVHDRVMHETGRRGAEAIITACSAASVQQQAVHLLAPFGRVCFFGGLPAGESQVPLDTNAIHYRQLVVTGVTGGSPRDFHAALRLLTSARLPVERVISHRFPMGELGKAFETALGGDTMKVVLVAEERTLG